MRITCICYEVERSAVKVQQNPLLWNTPHGQLELPAYVRLGYSLTSPTMEKYTVECICDKLVVKPKGALMSTGLPSYLLNRMCVANRIQLFIWDKNFRAVCGAWTFGLALWTSPLSSIVVKTKRLY